MAKCLRIFTWLIALTLVPPALSTLRYYSTQTPFGTGDNMVQTFHAHGGTIHPLRKWIAECMDGEAVVGVQDFYDDFERPVFLWCRFAFVNKPPSQGRYPYYPTCHVRDMTTQYFCFEPQNASRTINTFVTGMWDNEANFYVFRRTGTGINNDAFQPYKCCKTPPGYYIDYLSCYYVPTHDIYFEYYDSTFHNMVYCTHGFVMTGWSKKINPTDADWHFDWIQCCRIGYGPPVGEAPPTITAQSGMPSYSGAVPVPEGYRHQYRRSLPEIDERGHDEVDEQFHNTSSSGVSSRTSAMESMRYRRESIPEIYRSKGHSDLHTETLPFECGPGQSY